MRYRCRIDAGRQRISAACSVENTRPGVQGKNNHFRGPELIMKFRSIVWGLALIAPALFAQTGEITGRVTDSTGAIVPGAMVKVTSVATGADRDIQTNNEGYYNAPLLLPGEYKISVQREGFRPIT